MSDSKCSELRDVLTASVKRNLSNAVLLSGGLDSSIIAGLATEFTNLTGITIAYGGAPDLAYAKILTEKFPIKHVIKHLAKEDVSDAIENVIRIMKSFDPMEVRNTSVVYASMKELKANGFHSVMTGDGGDELFAGYNYMQRFDMEKLENELIKLWQIMHFSSITIGKELGISVKAPYLDKEFLGFAKQIPLDLKIKEQNGVKWGKWILRSCFEDYVTKQVAWREKMPLEQGAGINTFAQHFNSTLNDNDFSEKSRFCASHDSVRIRDREHLHYYSIYRKFFDAPKTDSCELRCPNCMGCVMDDSRFCRTCGAFPIQPIKDID